MKLRDPKEVPAYPEVVVGHVEVGELGEDAVRRQGPLDAELDLAAVGLEAVADLEADATHDHPDEVLDLEIMSHL